MNRHLEWIHEESTYILFENDVPVAVIHLKWQQIQNGIDDALEHCWFAGEALNTINNLVK